MLSTIYSDQTANPYNLHENEYLIIKDTDKVVDLYKWQDGQLRKVIVKPIDCQYHGIIKPKNIEQRCALDMLTDPTTTVKLSTGKFGTGKTFLGLVAAFHMIHEGQFDRLVYIRNNIEVKNSNPIGHLKGSYAEKMSVWAGPLIDFLGTEEELNNYIDRGLISIEHLGFIRGRSFSNSIIFITEAEHLTREHIQLMLGRVGEGSILVIEGDCRQIDAKPFESDNGIAAAISRLTGNRLFAYVHLNESVRSETAKLADLLDD